MPIKYSINQIKNKFNEIHNSKYDYSKFNEYKNTRQKIIIICPEHGDFIQLIKNHLKGHGCPYCSSVHKYSTSEFIKLAEKKHNFKYKYNNTNYINKKTKIIITCPEHGNFKQIPYDHLKGHGCPFCANNKKKTYNQFLKCAISIHKNLYSYKPDIKNFNNQKKIPIKCRIHNWFEQSPKDHLNGHGCPKCAIQKRSNKKRLTREQFIKNANKIHGKKYNYNNSKYTKTHNKTIIECPEHGIFQQTPHNHISMRHGCPKCQHVISSQETEISNFIKENYNKTILLNQRNILNNKELDIYLPDLKLAFEFNGLHWHSELYKDKNYHLDKTNECGKKGIHLIHIYEDDWTFKQDIVKSRILNLFGKSERIFARKTKIQEVSYKDSKEFLDMNHLQGNCISKIRLGLYYNNELISLMTFGKLRKNLNSTDKSNKYELLRFCNKINTYVVGGANKLFKHFVKEHNPHNVISYADRSWTMNNDKSLYNKLGFKFIHLTNPNYYYIVNKIRKNRFLFRKDILIKNGSPKNLTEHQIMFNQKIYRIYNSGNIKFEYII